MGCCSSRSETVHPESLSNSQLFKKLESKVHSDDFSFEFDIQYWKKLIDKLIENKSLREYAYSVRHDQFRSINDLIQFLANYNCKNDFEKAWLIYLWITHNIAYNIEGYQTGNYGQNDTDSVLRCGYSVCAGYANLFLDLCTGLKVKCKKISGYSKGFGYEPGKKFTREDHAWNAVNIDNKWYYVESTWGAGSCTKDFKFERKFNPYWFLTPPQIFIYSHYSESFQLQSNKMTLQQYEEMPLFDLDFHLFELKCLSHNSSIIKTVNRELFIEFSVPKNILIIANLKEINSDLKIDNTVVVQRDARTNNYGIITLIPEKSKQFKLNVYGKYDTDSSVDESYKFLTYFLVTRTGDVSNDKIPRYSIEFKSNLRCASHFSQLIRVKENPIQLNFISLKQLSLTADLRDKNDKKIKNNVLVQKLKDKNEYEIRVVLPHKEYLYDLCLFVKQETGSFNLVGKMKLQREQDNSNEDYKKFYTSYSSENLEYYVYSPLELSLKTNEIYQFKFFIKNVEQVALCDKGSNWYFLNLESDSIWSLNQMFTDSGDLTVFYKKTSYDKKFDALCSYVIL